MKKKYFAPETKEIKLMAQPLLFGGSNGDGTANGGGSKGDLGSSDEILSRQGGDGFWDDEE